MTEAMNLARGAIAGRLAVTTRNTARAGGSVSVKNKSGTQLKKHGYTDILKYSPIKCA